MANPPASTQGKAQEEEADRVEDVYKWAMALVGAAAVAQTLALWAETGAAPSEASISAMTRTLQTVLKKQRGWLFQLAMSYYRLNRALRTGKTVESPYGRNDSVSVEILRREFESVVNEIVAHRGVRAPSTGTPTLHDDEPRPELPPVGPEDRVPLQIEKSPVDVKQIEKRIEDDAQERLDKQLKEIQGKRHLAEIEKIEKIADPKKREEKRKEEKATRGSSMAAIAENITYLASRGLTYDLSEYDHRVYGWIRYSKTDTPCYWCAALISRGFVPKSSIYKSARTASKNEVGEEFHKNCQCVAVPVFTSFQLHQSPLFDKNREYAKEWQHVSQNASGDVMKAWRKHWTQRSKKATTSVPNPTAAQAAA